MKTPRWFEDIDVLGALPDRELIERLRTLGDDAIADEIEFALALSHPGPAHNFSSEGRWVRERHYWSHTAHVVGYVPPTGTTQRLAMIQPATSFEADRTLIGQRVSLGLDGFQPNDYPGGEEESDGRVNRLLFHFAAQHFPSELEVLHFNVSRRIRQQETFGYLNQPLFVGLTVGEAGLDLRYLILPLRDSCNAAFFEALSSEVSRRGLRLSSEAQPAAALASDMAFRMTDKVRRDMEPVENFYLGLGFSDDKRSAPLRKGTYVIAQVPSAEQIVWADGGWEDWSLHLPTGRIVDRNDRRQFLPFNYVLLTVDTFVPPRAPLVTRGPCLLAASSGPSRTTPRGDGKATDDADLLIQVEIKNTPSETRLIYRFRSKIESLDLPEVIEGPCLKVAPERFHENLLEEMESLGKGRLGAHEMLAEKEIADRLVTKGRNLFDQLFQGDLREVYRLFRDKVESIQIVSEEPWIPWELVKPFDATGATLIDDDFFCLRYQLTRWLFADQGAAEEVRVDKLAAIHAGRVSGQLTLNRADDEFALVTELAAKRLGIADHSLGQDDATANKLVSLLEEGGLGLLHVIAHGDFDPKNPDLSGIMMTDKRRFLSDEISGPLKAQIGRSRPLVFLNSCLVGQQAFSLTGLGGWAQAFVGAGCGAFLGPQWSVNDNLAFEFAKVFYAELEKGRTFGQAAQTARLSVRVGVMPSLACLAPVVFAHPNGRLIFPDQSA